MVTFNKWLEAVDEPVLEKLSMIQMLNVLSPTSDAGNASLHEA
jgi:hypothetical protein